MRSINRVVAAIAALAALTISGPTFALAQRGHHPPAPAPQHHGVHHDHVVFVGGYFYDPFFGPYPWWTRADYPYPYYPIYYDNRAVLRVIATPKDAAVYVDGFYAGTVHDFNDWFQGLPLTPGGHEIVLFLEGYRTTHDRLYLAPASTLKLRHTLQRLPAGEPSEPPTVAAPIPRPADGTFIPPHTATDIPPLATQAPASAAHGTLSLRVEPSNADVFIDGEKWISSDGKRFEIQLPAGPHRIEAVKSGFRRYSSEVEVKDGETTKLSVSLTPET